ncbi:MAG: hypothetical protein J0L75_05095 [Spirochaetes bacterium]|nr:hypothetical protein [Spirochaetota bacterium]
MKPSPKIAMPNVWGEGAPFALSGLDAPTDYARPVVGKLLEGRFGLEVLGLRDPAQIHLAAAFEFHLTSADPREAARLKVPRKLAAGSVVTNDRILWKRGGSSVLELLAVDRASFFLSVKGVKRPLLLWKKGPAISSPSISGKGFTVACAEGSLELGEGPSELLIRAVYPSAPTLAVSGPGGVKEKALVDAARKRHLQFWSRYRAPKTPSASLRMMDAKAASILRVNVESAQGKTSMRWTTPDRTPHRQMWIWDSAFHALGWKYLDAAMAREAIFAVLERTHGNGFIPISVDPLGDRLNGESQPPILGWALDRVLPVERLEPKARVWAYGKLSAFLGWMGRERVGAGRGLLGWLKAEDSVTCRCGESGWDNSTRFDHPGPDDHIDLVSFAANEYAVLARLAASLGKKSESEAWENKRRALADRVNELMWCEEDGLYYDLDQAGAFVRVQSAACFYPLAAGIPTPARSARLREALLDPKRFATRVPVPSISPAEKAFAKDMWRGPMWVNSNYLIADGLRRYGFAADAKGLVGKTLAELARWYQTTGVLCEYYDVDGKEDPRFQLRKASRTEGLRVIRDYGWTASLALAMAREF